MSIPLLQKARIGAYIIRQQLSGRRRYPLVLMLEPLFRCNLACAGCGKIDYPDAILNQRLSVEQCLAAVDECGAPVVSIAGGEPLLHKEIDAIVSGIVGATSVVSVTSLGPILGPVFTFSTLPFRGSLGDHPPARPVAGAAGI